MPGNKRVGIFHSGSPDKNRRQMDNLLQEIANGLTGVPHDVLPPLWAKGNDADLKKHPKDLVDPSGPHKVDILVAAGGSAAASAAMAATTSKDIVFTSTRFKQRPPQVTNVTGIYAGTSPEDELERLKRLQRHLVGATRFGAVLNKSRDNRDLVKTALGLGNNDYQEIDPAQPIKAQLQTAFNNFSRYDGVVVTADRLFYENRKDLIDVANIPTIYQWAEFVEEGGYMSYGPDLTQCYEMAAALVGRIVQGEKAKDIGIQTAPSIWLLNLDTAEQLDITLRATAGERAKKKK